MKENMTNRPHSITVQCIYCKLYLKIKPFSVKRINEHNHFNICKKLLSKTNRVLVT